MAPNGFKTPFLAHIFVHSVHRRSTGFEDKAQFNEIFLLFCVQREQTLTHKARERKRNVYRVIATDIWNAMKTNMTVCGCFRVDVIICCRRTACGMRVFRFCTLCVSCYLFQEDLSYWGYFSGKGKEKKRKGRRKKKDKKCSSTGSFSTLTHQLMSAVRTWENRPCLRSSLPLQAWRSAE